MRFCFTCHSVGGKMGKKTKLGPTRLGVLLWMLCVGV